SYDIFCPVICFLLIIHTVQLNAQCLALFPLGYYI
ncbi:MAG: hypothetical protein ACJAS9_001032, partial [Polaribacter sp.]